MLTLPNRARRNTRQRLVMLEEVTSHPTATMMYDAAGRRLPQVNLGTVYRNLKVLAENRVARRLDIGGGQARVDGSPERGYHVRRVRCARVVPSIGRPMDTVLTYGHNETNIAQVRCRIAPGRRGSGYSSGRHWPASRRQWEYARFSGHL